MREAWIFLFCAALLACSPKTYNPVQEPASAVVLQPAAVKVDSSRAVKPALAAGVDTVVGHTDLPLTKAQPESSLGNFVADAMLAAGRKLDPEAVVAVCNYGAIRLAYLPPGPISRAQIRQLMPFDNVLVVLRMPGSTLLEFCNLMARRKGWPVSGLSFRIRDGRAEEVQVQGEPLNTSKVYKVVVSNYLAKGGDECGFLSGLPFQRSRILVRDAMIVYLSSFEKTGRVLHPAPEGRVAYVE